MIAYYTSQFAFVWHYMVKIMLRTFKSLKVFEGFKCKYRNNWTILHVKFKITYSGLFGGESVVVLLSGFIHCPLLYIGDVEVSPAVDGSAGCW